METELIILVCSILGFLTLGCILAVSACLCFVSKKYAEETNDDVTARSLNGSNSYIHYNSPRYTARHNKRRTSTASGLTQSTASFGVTERVDDCIELNSKIKEVEEPPPTIAETFKSDLNANESIVNLNTCNPNISTNMTVTEVGDTTRDTTNATLKSLHGTTTSLCEQCLTPSSPAPQPTNTETGGQKLDFCNYSNYIRTSLGQIINIFHWFSSLDIDAMMSDDSTAINILDGILPVFKSITSEARIKCCLYS